MSQRLELLELLVAAPRARCVRRLPAARPYHVSLAACCTALSFSPGTSFAERHPRGCCRARRAPAPPPAAPRLPGVSLPACTRLRLLQVCLQVCLCLPATGLVYVRACFYIGLGLPGKECVCAGGLRGALGEAAADGARDGAGAGCCCGRRPPARASLLMRALCSLLRARLAGFLWRGRKLGGGASALGVRALV